MENVYFTWVINYASINYASINYASGIYANEPVEYDEKSVLMISVRT